MSPESVHVQPIMQAQRLACQTDGFVQNHQVGQLSGFNGALVVFLEGGIRSVQGRGVQRLGERDALAFATDMAARYGLAGLRLPAHSSAPTASGCVSPAAADCIALASAVRHYVRAAQVLRSTTDKDDVAVGTIVRTRQDYRAGGKGSPVDVEGRVADQALTGARPSREPRGQ